MEKTKFGYKDIDQKDKPSRVNQVFTSVSNRYDLMNDIMSFGPVSYTHLRAHET